MWQFVLCHCFCCVKWNPEPLAGGCLTASANILTSVFCGHYKIMGCEIFSRQSYKWDRTEHNSNKKWLQRSACVRPNNNNSKKQIQTIPRKKTNFTSGCKQIQKPDADTISFCDLQNIFSKRKTKFRKSLISAKRMNWKLFKNLISLTTILCVILLLMPTSGQCGPVPKLNEVSSITARTEHKNNRRICYEYVRRQSVQIFISNAMEGWMGDI